MVMNLGFSCSKKNTDCRILKNVLRAVFVRKKNCKEFRRASVNNKSLKIVLVIRRFSNDPIKDDVME